jgi:hypothetical protein
MKRAAIMAAVALLVALGIAGAELLLGVAYTLETGGLFWTRQAATPGGLNPNGSTNYKLSPVYGYGYRPGYRASEGVVDMQAQLAILGESSLPEFWNWPANNYGFISPVDYPYTGPSGTVYIAVTGASIAMGLALYGHEMIADAIRAVPGYKSRPVQVINLTGGGWKQPQQAIALSYFASIGQQFHVVINLDGPSEAYLGWDNASVHKVEPALPAAQFVYGLSNQFVSNARAQELKAEALALRAASERTRSAIAHYWYRAMLARLEVASVDAENEMGKAVPGRDYPVMMQPRTFATEQEFAEYIAGVWVRGSIITAAIAHSVGAAYIHVLPPNQYFAKRKFSPEQARMAFSNPPWPGATVISAAYAAMVARGPELRRQGIAFLDLTGAFDASDAVLYYDACCHFRRKGYEIIMRDIGLQIRQLLAAAPRNATPAPGQD